MDNVYHQCQNLNLHPLYVYKAKKPSVCLSVHHIDNLPGTVDINCLTPSTHYPPTLSLSPQVYAGSAYILQQVEDKVEKT